MPILIKVNPPGDVEALWREAKRLKPKLERKEFDAALRQHLQHHDYIPDGFLIVDVPGLDEEKHPIMIEVGKVDEVIYNPAKKSRKSGAKYVHKTKDERLLTDSTGKTLILHGKTHAKDDGWLHH